MRPQILIALVFVIFLPPFSAVSSDHVIRLATQREGNLLASIGEPFVRCAMLKTQQPYEIIKVPWARAQRDTKLGLYDGFFMASRNVKRDDYAIWSKPFVFIKWLYVTLKEDNVNLDQANHLQYAANLGSARLIWLKNSIRKV